MFLRFFTYSYALIADLAFLLALSFGAGLGTVGGLPWWAILMLVLSAAFVVEANYFLATGRRFNKIEALGAIIVGAGLPLVVVVIVVLILVLVGIDLFS